MTPTRILVMLGFATLALLGAFLVAYLSRPSTITLDVSTPVGETVVCHVLVDGRAEAFQDVVPVSRRFEAREFAYAVVGTNPAGAELTVSATDQSGSGATVTATGVKGEFKSNLLGTAGRHGRMTSTHVTNMRNSATLDQGQTAGDQADEAQDPLPQ